MTFWKLPVAIAVVLGSRVLGSPVGAPQVASAQTTSHPTPQPSPTIETHQRPPTPPRTQPLNGTRPGGGLNPEDSSCSIHNDSVQALIPVENPVLTATAYPTFLFYIPFGAEEVQFGEFSLLTWPGEATRQYQTRFTLPTSPGIVSVTLPELPAYALAEDQTYRWYFQLYCQAGDGAQPDLTLQGAVQRVALTPERSQQIQSASPAVWYDTLARVAHRLQTDPHDSQFQTIWRELLQLIEAEDAEAAAFVGPIQSLEE
ncbi:MAG: DUF928 domain-containing protein [Cyanobacteria bacterium P01_A01_bin.114]